MQRPTNPIPPSAVHRARRVVATALLLAAATAAVPAAAAAITGIAIDNNSSPDLQSDTGTRLREFRTQATAPTAGTLAGDTVSFDARFAWMLAHRVLPGGPTVALLNSGLVAYDLAFRVEDPFSVGYTLSIDSVMRGFITAQWESNSGSGISGVFAAGTLMSASLDSGSGFTLLPALATTTAVATATDVNPFVNQLVFDTGLYDAGSFVGTRDFTLRFSSVGSNTIGALQNFNTGEADLRFGLDPLLSGFTAAGYPGVDGESADQHGHFLTIAARFNAEPAGQVSEPGTLALLGIGMLSLACRTKKASRREPAGLL